MAFQIMKNFIQGQNYRAKNSILHVLHYFFREDDRVDVRVDCWEGDRAAVGVWVVGLFSVLLLIGLSEGVCGPPGEWILVALARDTDLSKALIRSRACFNSVSAWMARSSDAWALSSVSLKNKPKILFSVLLL